MKVGLSTYSLSRLIKSGEMDIFKAIKWIAENGGEHAEIVPAGFSFIEDPSLVKKVAAAAKEAGIALSSYTIAADFIKEETEEFLNSEIERLKKEVAVAAELGVRLMRHDAAWRPVEQCTDKNFENDLPKLVRGCAEVARYAKQYGITTSVENHGFFVQESRRVQKLVKAVNMDNFKTTLDVGNFICADEDPVRAVKNNAPYASMVHLKDFYLRPKSKNPGDGFANTAGGNFRRGAILGHGDIDIRKQLTILAAAGYSGWLSIEFEGLEDPRTGSKTGMDNAKRFLLELGL
ncbi:MAG: sugar phosphate isomerase [Spirochaetes bacterium GWF1_41_5]|nr:MAG: sugar phosphate isomerase [Spirochaetes bacterium GWF1_41_5]HBE03450.1 sugar phosphate isomerase/epimerase [Spirochaetia bacterium]